jgi:hypothetical protein
MVGTGRQGALDVFILSRHQIGSSEQAIGKRQAASGKRQTAKGKRQTASGKRQWANGKGFQQSITAISFNF